MVLLKHQRAAKPADGGWGSNPPKPGPKSGDLGKQGKREGCLAPVNLRRSSSWVVDLDLDNIFVDVVDLDLDNIFVDVVDLDLDNIFEHFALRRRANCKPKNAARRRLRRPQPFKLLELLTPCLQRWQSR